MSNKVIVAAAGSGKTTFIINEALKIKNTNVLITTYTESNAREINKKFYEINGCIPKNIKIQTWFSFLIQHGVKPYQSVIYNGKINGLLLVNKKSGLRFYNKYKAPIYFGENDPEDFYFSKTKLIYSDKLAKFVVEANTITSNKVINRIVKIYPYIFVDEIQDMAGYDLEIIKLLFSSESNILLVGDPRQVTYHTHDEAKYKKYSDGKIIEFVHNECKNHFFEIDDTTLNKTYRNNRSICDLANSIYSEFKACECNEQRITGHDGVFFVLKSKVNEYLKRFSPMQLRDTKKTITNLFFPAINIGESKGLTFDRVLIYPTSKMMDWLLNHNSDLAPQSRAKLYVAITRARFSVAIVINNFDSIQVNGIENY